MKYILFQDFSGKPCPIIFPNRIEFEELREQVPYTRILSAGYVEMEQNGLRCHGKAASINAAAAGSDAEILTNAFVEDAQ